MKARRIIGASIFWGWYCSFTRLPVLAAGEASPIRRHNSSTD